MELVEDHLIQLVAVVQPEDQVLILLLLFQVQVVLE